MRHPSLPAVLGTFGVLAACACSGTTDQPLCSGVNDPTVLTLANVTPALGDTVANDAIVHSFSVTDDVAFSDIALGYLPSHTAGTPDPAIAFTYTIAAATTDFTSTPVVWSTAPGHVELEAPLIYQTPDGCAYTLPSPLFSYDVTGDAVLPSGDVPR